MSLLPSLALREVWVLRFCKLGHIADGCDHYLNLMKLRVILIILIASLCIAFLVEFWMFLDELRLIAKACDEANAGPIKWSCDQVPQHPVALLHALSFVLFAAVVFARKYYMSLVVGLGYLALDIYGTYSRLGTGFFGGNMCPDGHPCWAAIRRGTWFDWAALVILTVSIALISLAICKGKKEPKLIAMP